MTLKYKWKERLWACSDCWKILFQKTQLCTIQAHKAKAPQDTDSASNWRAHGAVSVVLKTLGSNLGKRMTAAQPQGAWAPRFPMSRATHKGSQNWRAQDSERYWPSSFHSFISSGETEAYRSYALAPVTQLMSTKLRLWLIWVRLIFFFQLLYWIT